MVGGIATELEVCSTVQYFPIAQWQRTGQEQAFDRCRDNGCEVDMWTPSNPQGSEMMRMLSTSRLAVNIASQVLVDGRCFSITTMALSEMEPRCRCPASASARAPSPRFWSCALGSMLLCAQAFAAIVLSCTTNKRRAWRCGRSCDVQSAPRMFVHHHVGLCTGTKVHSSILEQKVCATVRVVQSAGRHPCFEN